MCVCVYVCLCVCVCVCVRACMHACGQAGGCVCLLATTHDGAQRALDLFIYVASSVGLTVNLDKTKVMAAGYGLTEADRLPLDVAGEVVECVDSFRYLGSLLHTNGRSTPDISSCIAGASHAFDSNLSLATTRLVYEACMLSLLLYCAECCVPLKPDFDALCSFHLRCIRS